MNTQEIDPAATTANWYGDRGHHSLLSVWPAAETPAFQWEKTGFVRGLLWVPGDALPVYGKAYSGWHGELPGAALLSDICGERSALPMQRLSRSGGCQQLDTATAIRVALLVRRDWRKHWLMEAERFVRSGATITEDLVREWSHWGPMMGLALAAHGRAWLREGGIVRECSPAEAATVSERPITPQEYSARIDAAIASLRRLPH